MPLIEDLNSHYSVRIKRELHNLALINALMDVRYRAM